MTNFRFPLVSLGAAALVAACGGNQPVQPAQAPSMVPVAAPAGTVPPPGSTAPALRPGYGRVQSITPLQNGSRVAVQMEGGPLQMLDMQGGTFGLSLNQRVEVTADGHLRYPISDRL